MNLFIFLSIFWHIILTPSLEIDPVGWEQPTDLSKIKKIYKSGKINDDKIPIIAYEKVFFLQKEITKVYICDDTVYTLNPQYNLEPILYTKTIFDFQSLFMARECIIYIFKEMGKNTYQYNHLSKIDLTRDFHSCYYTLRIYYDYKTNYAAIYNYARNKEIFVLNLEKFKKYGNIKDSKIATIKNDYYVLKSLIYSNKEGDKSLLIVTDDDGVRFYDLQGYSSSWPWNNPGELKESYNEGYRGFIDFISGDKLLYATTQYFKVFELDPIKKIYEKYYSLYYGDYIKCLLGLKDGNVLIGSDLGYIYLISFNSGSLEIIDDIKICDEPVYSLSYTNNCVDGTSSCYKLAANCGRVLVFQIGIGDKSSKNTLGTTSNTKKVNNDDTDFNVGITFIIIILIIIIIYNYWIKDNNSNNDNC